MLILLARGMSNRQIAQRLVITPKTAGNHVEHIYAKIGATSRAAAAMFAVQHGLLPEEKAGQLRDHPAGHSLAPLLRGLPGDSCQCPHWGYLLAGTITVSYADREETYQAGDAFCMTPGHVPAAETGTEFIQFSPREQLAETLAAMRANAQRAAQRG